MIVARYEKGQKFLDLCLWVARGIDEDGCALDDECWECVIYENEADFNSHKTIEFANEMLALMYIKENNWTEQVL